MANFRKLGATAFQGHIMQGLAELRAAAPFADSPIAQATNYAMPGVATPGEVTEARREESMMPEPLEVGQVERDPWSIDRDERGMDLD